MYFSTVEEEGGGTFRESSHVSHSFCLNISYVKHPQIFFLFLTFLTFDINVRIRNVSLFLIWLAEGICHDKVPCCYE